MEMIQVNIPKGAKAFVFVGTSEIGDWAVDNRPFIVVMETFEDFDEQGFDEDEFNMCQQLEVGQICNDFDFEGIYVMRIQ